MAQQVNELADLSLISGPYIVEGKNGALQVCSDPHTSAHIQMRYDPIYFLIDQHCPVEIQYKQMEAT